MSVAPRVLLAPERRGPARTGAEPGRPLDRGATGVEGPGHRQGTACSRSKVSALGAPAHRHRRRRRSGQRRGGDAPARGLRRQPHPAQRRHLGPLRPAQPVQGLPRWHRTRGMDSPPLPGVLRRAGHRAATRHPGHRHHSRATRGEPRARRDASLRRPPPGDGREPGASADSGGRPAARLHPSQPGRRQGHHRPRHERHSGAGPRGELHRPRGGRRPSCPRRGRAGGSSRRHPHGAGARARARPLRAEAPRGTRRRLPARPDRAGHRLRAR